jgi:hypothetical protein
VAGRSVQQVAFDVRGAALETARGDAPAVSSATN